MLKWVDNQLLVSRAVWYYCPFWHMFYFFQIRFYLKKINISERHYYREQQLVKRSQRHHTKQRKIYYNIIWIYIWTLILYPKQIIQWGLIPYQLWFGWGHTLPMWHSSKHLWRNGIEKDIAQPVNNFVQLIHNSTFRQRSSEMWSLLDIF